MNRPDAFAILLILSLVAILFGLSGFEVGKRSKEKEAVKAGVGEYYLNKDTLEAEFRFITNNATNK